MTLVAIVVVVDGEPLAFAGGFLADKTPSALRFVDSIILFTTDVVIAFNSTGVRRFRNDTFTLPPVLLASWPRFECRARRFDACCITIDAACLACQCSSREFRIA